MLNKHKQQIMTSPCKKKKTETNKNNNNKKKLSIKQVYNAGKYVQLNIANEAQITGHRTRKYIIDQRREMTKYLMPEKL